MQDPKAFKTFAEFYPFQLTEHSNKTCCRLYFVGASLTLVCIAMLIATGKLQYLLYSLLCDYGFAWIGHFGFEENKPVGLKRPLYSLMGDWAVLGHLAGQSKDMNHAKQHRFQACLTLRLSAVLL